MSKLTTGHMVNVAAKKEKSENYLSDAVAHAFVRQRDEFFSLLQGKILTIIDASIVDENQKKAVKDLIKNTIWSYFGPENVIASCLYDALESHRSADNPDVSYGKPHYYTDHRPVIIQELFDDAKLG